MTFSVSIPGMHCESCASLIRDVSADYPAISSLNIDLKTKNVTIEAADGFDLQDWKKAVEELGPTYAVHLAA
jgi:copper chaperone CopZ